MVWLLFLFYFFLTTPGKKISTANSLNDDIIIETCKKCGDMSLVLDYNFCWSSLQAIPASHVTNLQGLAIIAMELALENASNTISSIISLMSNESFDLYTLACLEDCLELYTDAVLTLVDAVASFSTGQYGLANIKVSAAMEASTTCQQSFTDQEEETCPLTRENYDLFQLCEIALCIINTLGRAVTHS